MLIDGMQIVLNNSKAVGFVKNKIGSGSQGEVYTVVFQEKAYAAKVYLSRSNLDNQVKIITNLIQLRAPSDCFLWPIDTFHVNNDYFGFIMPLREKRFRSLNGLLKRTYDPTFMTLINASINIVNSFWQLHSQGLCYRDISLNNIFFDPLNGDIQICDNDNVFLDNNEQSDVFGTYKFMAPEIVTGKSLPNTNTDLFSLAVLLFYIFYIHHPFEGEKEYKIHCFDEPAMRKLYGTNPVYIFDSHDDQNRPVKHYQDNPICFHSIYPEFFKKVFHDTFTKGVHDPNKRIRETMWRKKLFQLRDALFLCPYCNAENFHDPESKSKNICWHCSKEIRPDFILTFPKYNFPLYSGKKIFPEYFIENNQNNGKNSIGYVTTHPNDKSILGLQNLSDLSWIIYSSSGSSINLEPGKTFTLKKGARIIIYNKEGLIR